LTTAQRYEESHGSIENAWFLVVSYGGFDGILSRPLSLAAAQRKTAAFGEEMALFYTVISPFLKQSKCAPFDHFVIR
jgi:hypothetical protein